jgi:hypothetical protein
MIVRTLSPTINRSRISRVRTIVRTIVRTTIVRMPSPTISRSRASPHRALGRSRISRARTIVQLRPLRTTIIRTMIARTTIVRMRSRTIVRRTTSRLRTIGTSRINRNPTGRRRIDHRSAMIQHCNPATSRRSGRRVLHQVTVPSSRADLRRRRRTNQISHRSRIRDRSRLWPSNVDSV